MSTLMRSAPLAVILLSGACATRGGVAVPAPSASLQQRIDSIADAPPHDRSHWGVHIVDVQNGAVLYSRNAHRHFIPASNQKLVVSATALARLGPEFRYETKLYESARMGDSAAAVFVIGSGDPTWSARFHGSAVEPFDSMAAIVSRAGVRAIGELVIDASRFTDEQVHPAWEVADLPLSYAPPVTAFAAAEGTFRLVVRGGTAPGEAGRFEVIGAVPQPVRADITTGAMGSRAVVRTDYTARRDTIYVTATLPPGAADTSTFAVTQPARSAAAMLADALDRAGVRVHGVTVTHDSARLRAHTLIELGSVRSPPLAQIVAGILRPSQNWIAEQLHKTLGAMFANDGSWRGGALVERAYLMSIGIDSLAFLLRDASGMTVQNLLAPDAITTLLVHAHAQPWAQVFRDALAAPALTGSTLSNRLRALEGRVFAKTGSVTNVNTLSGYVIAANGRTYAFSIMNNASGISSAPVRNAIDAIVSVIALHDYDYDYDYDGGRSP